MGQIISSDWFNGLFDYTILANYRQSRGHDVVYVSTRRGHDVVYVSTRRGHDVVYVSTRRGHNHWSV